jgi:acyl-CoA hydrolase
MNREVTEFSNTTAGQGPGLLHIPSRAPSVWQKHSSRLILREELQVQLDGIIMQDSQDVLVPRPVRDSQSEMNEIVLPNDTNPLGALLGGRLMHWIDLAGALAAHRHSHHYVVTASIDHMDFWTPVHVGDLVILRSSVNRVFTTSMEVGVQVSVENYLLNDCKHVSSAYLTFVAVDGAGRHVKVAPVIPETPTEKRRYDDAGRRREIRRAELERRRANMRKRPPEHQE